MQLPYLAPEVIQTSEMDCGPAGLKTLLDGHGIPVSYGRLREACQTGVDGTSIDTLEDLAVQFGLNAEQIMLPPDHVALDESQALPALVVVRLPSGAAHFVVAWRRHGQFLQVMDPGVGRRWMTWRRFADDLFIHRHPVAAAAWREWAGSDEFLRPLHRRLQDLQVPEAAVEELIGLAKADPGWQGLAALDAAARLTAAIARARGLGRSEATARVVRHFFERARGEPPPGVVPLPFWSVQPASPALDQAGLARGEPQLLLVGAVLVRVLGRRDTATDQEKVETRPPLPPELAAALVEPPARPDLALWRALRQDGLLTPGLLAAALFLASLGVMLEALLLQGLMHLGLLLPLPEQRLFGLGALLAFVAVLLVVELPMAAAAQRIGRRLETRLRVALLEKIPRLGDHYFHSRLTSDLTHRAHDLRQLRQAPALGMSFLRLSFQLVLTTAGVIWLDPVSGWIAVGFGLVLAAFTYAVLPPLTERDLRLRTHTGALNRFYLDALLGLIPLRTHGAERALRREQESLLVEWTRASVSLVQISTVVQALGALMYTAFAVAIGFNFVGRGGNSQYVLLFLYWTLNLPALAQAMAGLAGQYPLMRNRVLRLLEPLGAPDEEAAGRTPESAPAGSASPESTPREHGLSISMDGVTVQVAGRAILSGVNLQINAGEHIAIVGHSGAGKSTLVGLLLGWRRPAAGRVQVDGQPLDPERLGRLRSETAWVDPTVQLWNRSLLYNLHYGDGRTDAPTGQTLEPADLFDLAERLPDGLQTILGESGGLVSGGEGQQVRLGRAMNRAGARLVILDEPFRALNREKRRALLQATRAHWRDATLLCITHDIGETRGFRRVLVIADGRIVEDGSPGRLAARKKSRYRALLDGEEAVRRGLWEGAHWRRLWLEGGRLSEKESSP